MKAKKNIQRLGILGGTFDPPHIGHLIIAETALEELQLDRVIFVPAAIPPHKVHRTTATGQQRLAMVRLAIKGNRKLEVSSSELNRSGISYTVDTLRHLREAHEPAELFLIIGSDNYRDFHSWESPEEILQLSTIAVYHRKGFDSVRPPVSLPRAVELKGPTFDISSSDIRRRVSQGISVRYLVPRDVDRYMKVKNLYRTVSPDQ